MSDIVATNQTILVVGGGISGISAALEAAEAGKQVILVEKNPYIGGRVTQLHKYFPKLCHPTCGMEINQRRAKSNPNLTILTMAEVTDITGDKGDYSIKVKLKPRYVNNKCTACGKCSDAVEAEFDNEFNYGLNQRKGAYIAYNNAYPQTYVLDERIIGTDDASKAKEACPVDAVDLDMQEEILDLKAGAVVWATGWRPYDANKIQPYGYDRFQNVITNVEFERMNDLMGPTGGKVVRPSDGAEPKKVAFIQCAGSRDRNYLMHCSRICCMASLKQTHYVRENIEGGTSDIYYIDIRAIDRFEDFYKAVQNDETVKFIKSKVANITEGDNNNPVLNGVDTEGYHRYANEYDLVVLATGMEPSVNQSEFPVEIVMNEEGFIEMDEKNGGVFAAGCSSDALDVNRAVQSATASALRAIQVINQVSGVE
jgi:quinone-modifying oxidoreductase subunit QmoA